MILLIWKNNIFHSLDYSNYYPFVVENIFTEPLISYESELNILNHILDINFKFSNPCLDMIEM